MFPRFTPNAALLVDAAGCFAGASLLILSSTIWSWTDLPADWRLPVAVALFVFSVLLVMVARYPVRPMIAIAVLGNIAWIIAGAVALVATDSILGMGIIALVMIADAIMGWFQAKGLYPFIVVVRNNIN